jgi:glucose/arabinose dehydrogenase
MCLLALAIGASGATGASERGQARLVRVVSGLDSPVLVTAAPGEPDRLYVVEQSGLVRVVVDGKLRAAPFLDLRSGISAGGERGLLGLAFPPDFEKSRFLVVNYTDRSGNTRVVRYRSNGTRALPSSAMLLVRVNQPYGNHNGGMVLFGPDGLLYVGLGDGGAGGDPQDLAQSPGTLLGKLFTLDVRKPSARPKLVAYGLRNPWRYSFDRSTRDLWIGDVGQGSIEEINRLPAGTTDLVNFGWDVYEGRQEFEDKPLGPGRLIQPVAQYSHDQGCSVTGGYVYRGPGVPALRGRYVFGDYCSGRIWSIPGTGKSGRLRLESIRVPALTSFGEDLDGRLYAVSHQGTVYRIA